MTSIKRRAVFLGSAAFVFLPAAAHARAAVVAAAGGTPHGHAGTSPERVLRVGVDIEVGDTIETRSGEIVNLAFLDGTSLTIAEDSAIRVDRFSFALESGKGELALTTGGGEFRLIGGRIGESGEITIATPSGTIGIREAVFACTVSRRVTLAAVLQGKARRLGVSAMPGAFPVPAAVAQATAPFDAASCDLDEPITPGERLVIISILGHPGLGQMPPINGFNVHGSVLQARIAEAMRNGVPKLDKEIVVALARLSKAMTMVPVQALSGGGPLGSVERSMSGSAMGTAAGPHGNKGFVSFRKGGDGSVGRAVHAALSAPITLRITSMINKNPTVNTVTLTLHPNRGVR